MESIQSQLHDCQANEEAAKEAEKRARLTATSIQDQLDQCEEKLSAEQAERTTAEEEGARELEAKLSGLRDELKVEHEAAVVAAKEAADAAADAAVAAATKDAAAVLNQCHGELAAEKEARKTAEVNVGGLLKELDETKEVLDKQRVRSWWSCRLNLRLLRKLLRKLLQVKMFCIRN